MIKRVLKDCLPTVFSLMLLSMYAVVDGLFIGNFAGDIGLAAINIAWPITALITAIGVGIGIGCSVLISLKRGQNDTEASKKIFCVAFTFLVLTALILLITLYFTYPQILTLLGAKAEVFTEASKYSHIIILGLIFQLIGAGIIPILRNYDMSFQAMLCMISGTIVNVIVNYSLICVAQIGIQGAAFGTIIAQFCVCVIAITILIKKAKIKIRPQFDKSLILRICKIGLTGFGVSMAPSITLIFTNWQCLAYGGDSTVACYAVITYVAWPIQGMLSGVGEGSQPLMSFYCGKKESDNLHLVCKISKTLAVIMSIVMAIAVYFAIPYIAVWFGLSSEASANFNLGMTIYALSFVVVSLARFNVCYLNASLQTNKAILLTYLESLAISPALLFILPNFFYVTGIWLSYIVSAFILLILYYIINPNKVRRTL